MSDNIIQLLKLSVREQWNYLDIYT